jgi:hypothetical protein
MVISVDIDRTLCTYARKNGKKTAIPNRDVIDRVNALYDKGHEIIIWTSRNVISRRDQTKFTKDQLRDWGVRYTSLDMEKPYFDLFVDDRAVNVAHWMEGIPIPNAGEDFK